MSFNTLSVVRRYGLCDRRLAYNSRGQTAGSERLAEVLGHLQAGPWAAVMQQCGHLSRKGLACLKSFSTSGGPWSGGSRCSRQVRLSLRMASSKNSLVLQRAEVRLSEWLLQRGSKLHRMEEPSSKGHCKGSEREHNIRGASCSHVWLKPLRRQVAGSDYRYLLVLSLTEDLLLQLLRPGHTAAGDAFGPETAGNLANHLTYGQRWGSCSRPPCLQNL